MAELLYLSVTNYPQTATSRLPTLHIPPLVLYSPSQSLHPLHTYSLTYTYVHVISDYVVVSGRIITHRLHVCVATLYLSVTNYPQTAASRLPTLHIPPLVLYSPSQCVNTCWSTLLSARWHCCACGCTAVHACVSTDEAYIVSV